MRWDEKAGAVLGHLTCEPARAAQKGMTGMSNANTNTRHRQELSLEGMTVGLDLSDRSEY